MGKLTTRARKAIPKKEFGLPGKKKYPMPDKAHAANAKARATQMVKRGKLSESSKEKIDAKANRILGEKKGEKKEKHPSKKHHPKTTTVRAHRTLAGYRK